MIDTPSILQPVIALVAWSMIMWFWMLVTRLPAVRKARIKLDPNSPRGEQMSNLPANVRWKADNYTHLMEQPTIFYALALSLALIDASNSVNYMLAWSYVSFRIIHSLVQSILNKIELRFIIYIISNIPLLALTVNAISAL